MALPGLKSDDFGRNEQSGFVKSSPAPVGAKRAKTERRSATLRCAATMLKQDPAPSRIDGLFTKMSNFRSQNPGTPNNPLTLPSPPLTRGNPVLDSDFCPFDSARQG
jgi:hypothetical protein